MSFRSFSTPRIPTRDHRLRRFANWIFYGPGIQIARSFQIDGEGQIIYVGGPADAGDLFARYLGQVVTLPVYNGPGRYATNAFWDDTNNEHRMFLMYTGSSVPQPDPIVAREFYLEMRNERGEPIVRFLTSSTGTSSSSITDITHLLEGRLDVGRILAGGWGARTQEATLSSQDVREDRANIIGKPTSSTDVTINLLPGNGGNLDGRYAVYMISHDGTGGKVTVSPDGSETFANGDSSFDLHQPGEYIIVVNDDADWHIVSHGHYPAGSRQIATTTSIDNTMPDGELIQCESNTGGFTITLPDATTVRPGYELHFKKFTGDANIVTIQRDNSSDSIDGEASVKLYSRYDYISIKRSDVPGSPSWSVTSRGGKKRGTQKITSNTVLNNTVPDGQLIHVDCSSGNVTITLMDSAEVPDGYQIRFKRVDGSANSVNINRDNPSDDIDGSASISLTNQYDHVTLEKSDESGVPAWSIVAQN